MNSASAKVRNNRTYVVITVIIIIFPIVARGQSNLNCQKCQQVSQNRVRDDTITYLDRCVVEHWCDDECARTHNTTVVHNSHNHKVAKSTNVIYTDSLKLIKPVLITNEDDIINYNA